HQPCHAFLTLLPHPPSPRLVVKGLRRGAENDRSAGLVVLHRFEGAEDELPLSLLEGGPQRQKHGIALLASLGGGDVKRKKGWSDELLVATDHRPLDDVPELADIARPRMIAQPHHRRLVDCLDVTAILLVE